MNNQQNPNPNNPPQPPNQGQPPQQANPNQGQPPQQPVQGQPPVYPPQQPVQGQPPVYPPRQPVQGQPPVYQQKPQQYGVPPYPPNNQAPPYGRPPMQNNGGPSPQAFGRAPYGGNPVPYPTTQGGSVPPQPNVYHPAQPPSGMQQPVQPRPMNNNYPPNQYVQPNQVPYPTTTPYGGYNNSPPPMRQPVVPVKTETFEEKYGGKITVIIGVGLLLLAVIFGLYYTFTLIDSDIVKPIVAYTVGAALLLLSEVARRKMKLSYFSTGLCAGGISVLFATTIISTTTLELFAPSIALLIFVGIFVLATFLSIRYNAEIISIFAVIGSAIPLFSISDTLTNAIITIIYVALINVLVITVSIKKDWKIIKLFSIAFNIIFCHILINDLYSLSEIVVTIAIFAIFIAYFLLTTLKHTKVGTWLNAFDIISLISVSLLFAVYGTESLEYMFKSSTASLISFGILTVVHMVFYIIWSQKVRSDNAGLIYFITGFGISLFMCLFTGLEDEYVFPVLAAVGIVILMINVYLKQVHLKVFGSIATSLGLLVFLSSYKYGLLEGLFFFEHPDIELVSLIIHTVITVLIGALLALKLQKPSTDETTPIKAPSQLFDFFKAGAFANLWFFLLAVIAFFTDMLPNSILNFWYMFGFCLVSFGLPILLHRSKIQKSIFTKITSSFIVGFGFLYLLQELNVNYMGGQFKQNTPLMITTILAVLFANVLAIVSLYTLLNDLIVNNKTKEDIIPITISLTTLVLLYMICYNYIPNVSGIILSVVVLVCALGMVIYGFRKLNKLMRLIGLGLSMVAVFKIFVVDMEADGWQRVLGFALSGVVFILISFAYQYFSNLFIQGDKSTENAPVQVSVGQNVAVNQAENIASPVVSTTPDLEPTKEECENVKKVAEKIAHEPKPANEDSNDSEEVSIAEKESSIAEEISIVEDDTSEEKNEDNSEDEVSENDSDDDKFEEIEKDIDEIKKNNFESLEEPDEDKQ